MPYLFLSCVAIVQVQLHTVIALTPAVISNYSVIYLVSWLVTIVMPCGRKCVVGRKFGELTALRFWQEKSLKNLSS